MMEQCKEKLSIAMFTGQNQLRSDGLWGSWIRQHKKTLSRVSGKRKKKYHPNGCVDKYKQNVQDNRLHNFFASTICNLAYEYLHIVSVSPETG